MEQANSVNGGILVCTEPISQIVYLDFDGELTSYNGEILDINEVKVQNSLLPADRISAIVAKLNKLYESQNVIFTTIRPVNTDFSTIYIGKTTAFSPYGSFAGVAETIDYGNYNKNDNAFVMLDANDSDETIISTISHETDHLLGELSHEGDGLAAYAADIIIGDGVTSSGLDVADGNKVYVSSGGIVDTINLNGGDIVVRHGGTVNKAFLSGFDVDTTRHHAVADIYGTANNTIIDYGWMRIYSGGVANDTTVSAGGSMHISNCGVANDTTMSGGSMYVSSGGNASGIIMSGGDLRIYSGGSASEMTMSGGSMSILNGGSADNTTVNYGGYLYISSGGTATKVKENGGYVDIKDGANVEFIENTISGITISNHSATAHLKTTMQDVLLESKGSLSLCGGNISGVIMSGGSTATTNVYMHVAQGIAINIHMFGGANLSLMDNGITNAITMSNGNIHVSSGGIASDITMSNGNIHVSSGGIASDIIMSGGYIHISNGGIASDITMSRGSLTIHDGGVVDNISVDGYLVGSAIQAASMWVSGGNVNDVVINKYGDVYVSGGHIDNVTVNTSGVLYIYSGGTATHIKENGGYVRVFAGATVEFVSQTLTGMVVSQWATPATFHSNTILVSTTIVGSGRLVLPGGVASETIMSGGSMSIYDGGIAEDVTVHSGSMTISNGGVVRDVTMNSGSMSIYDGGIAEDVTVHSGSVTISNGGVVRDVTMNSGSMVIGGIAEDVTVHRVSMTVSSGGLASNTIVSSGGSLSILVGGSAKFMIVESGGFATANEAEITDVTINSNAIIRTSMTVVNNLTLEQRAAAYLSGGVVRNAEVDSLGMLQLASGTTAVDTIINKGGHFYIGSGACVTGELTIEAGATVLAFTGSELNFSLLDCEVNNSDALVTNFNLIRGNINYSITVDDAQAAGKYKLADGVTSFNKAVDLNYGNELLDNTLSIGNEFTFNGFTFELSLNDNSLYLDISGTPIDTITYSSELLVDYGLNNSVGTDLINLDGNDDLKNSILA